MSIRQLEAELDISYRTLCQRIERAGEALDALAKRAVGDVEFSL